ncbi:hypothetical protein ACMD2_08910 [Ananas comosus]|uniref:Uncharacterized protein n=1 Tax=Ananas comosus TaxID=4615 RepID=A0A199V4X6_ANACO|nr:hypothetical protein ACMD2_08910 [Ananas comosus]
MGLLDQMNIMLNANTAKGDRCKLNLVPGCMDPSSPLFNPLLAGPINALLGRTWTLGNPNAFTS